MGMSDAEALEELAAALHHVREAEEKAETEIVASMLGNSEEHLEDQIREVVNLLGEKEYYGEDFTHSSR